MAENKVKLAVRNMMSSWDSKHRQLLLYLYVSIVSMYLYMYILYIYLSIASGNGYARSEGIVAMILQKHKDSKRIYAQIIHSKTNSDGAKENGKSIYVVSKILLLEVNSCATQWWFI